MATFPTTILLATDGSPDARMATQAAGDLAARSASRLHVVHGWEPYTFGGFVPGGYPFTGEEAGRALLADEAAFARSRGADVVQTHLRRAVPARAILDVAEEVNAGLIAMGSRGLGTVRRLVMGSVSETVVHQANMPVLVMRGHAIAWPPRRLVVGDDGSPGALAALRLAGDVARLFGSELIVVRAVVRLQDTLRDTLDQALETRVGDDVLEYAQGELEDHVGALDPRVAALAKVRISVEDPAQALLQAAAEVAGGGIVVVGSRGLGLVQRLRFGSVSTRVLRAAGGPVLVGLRPREVVHAEARERQAELARP